ncbi:MAG: hypothetical protein ACXAB7_05455 [Candidatus Kariarchaeaceae archaeon]
MSKTIELDINDLQRLVKIGRYGIGMAFVLLILMLFHVLIDFFYHT